MRPEHVIEQNGRSYVKYAGVLDEAHSQGMSEMTTAIIERPCEANDESWIVQAVVTLEQWDERTSSWRRKTFSGLGEANKVNTARHLHGALLRMAETRAKARALKDAVNVGMCSVEELTPEETAKRGNAPRPAAPARPASAPRATAAARPAAPSRPAAAPSAPAASASSAASAPTGTTGAAPHPSVEAAAAWSYKELDGAVRK